MKTLSLCLIAASLTFAVCGKQLIGAVFMAGAAVAAMLARKEV